MVNVRDIRLALTLAALVQAACQLTAQPIAEIAKTLKNGPSVDTSFACTGTVGFLVNPHGWYFTMSDVSGSAIFNINQLNTPVSIRPGDILATSGTVRWHDENGKAIPSSPLCEKTAVLGHVPPPPAPVVPIGELLDDLHSHRPVRIQGCWEDLFADEIDPNWIFGILSDGRDRLFVARRTEVG